MKTVTKTIEHIVSRPRKCASDWLIIQARELAQAAKEQQITSPLVYACLEARNAIEQLWFELLMLIHGGSLDETILEKYRRRKDGYLAAIGDAEPRYRQLSRFTAIAMQLDNHSQLEVVAWDLGRLKKYWQKLSNYCHAQAHPTVTIENPKWIADGHELIEDIYGYFNKEMSRGATGLMPPENMTANARLIWEEFAVGKIDEDAVRIRLRIVQPLRR